MIVHDALRASRALGSMASSATRHRLRHLSTSFASAPSPGAIAHWRWRRLSTVATSSSAEANAVAASASTTPAATPPYDDSSEASATASAIAARFRGHTCLIQGASRGLGLEFVRQLLEVPDTTVIATCRSPATASGLQQLQAVAAPLSDGAVARGGGAAGGLRRRLLVVALDLCDEAGIQCAAEEVSAAVPCLDLLINCSAVLHGPDGMAPETSYSRIRGDHMALSFATNAIGPMLVARSFLPLLLSSPGATERQPALIANMSARVGSLGDNRLGGWYSYRASKAALNQMGLTLALELRRKRAAAAVVMLHPGTCDTDLSRPYHRNVPPGKLFDRPRAVRQLLGILAGLRAEDSGRFIAWDGQDVPW